MVCEVKTEIDNYAYLFDNIDNINLQNRMRISFNYYVKMAVRYKRIWNVLTLLSIVLPAFATFTSVLAIDVNKGDNVMKYVLPGISAMTTIVTGFLGSYKVAEKKRTYRNSAEEIKALATDYWENVRRAANDDEISDLQTHLLNSINGVIKEEKRVMAAMEQKEK